MNTIHRTTFTVLMLVGLLCILFIFSQWRTINERIEHQWNSTKINTSDPAVGSISNAEKQRGAHVFGSIDTADFQTLHDSNLEWITLVSWGFQDDYDSPIVGQHKGDSLYILQHNAHWQRRIESVREAGFKVFLKPHLWIDSPTEGTWRSDIYPTSEENWALWKKTYRNFILRYAAIAEAANAEMFCIGIEFSRLTVEKPEFWIELIQEVRSIYSGKITYAANWYQEYENISFWDQLDFIGIQAYFPLAKNKTPSVESISKSWNKYLPVLETIHKKYNRNILFTEMGYRSTSKSAIKPWEWMEKSSEIDDPFSPETQANCYEAFFNTVWNKEWFAGVHIWQLRGDYPKNIKKNNLDFTPQGKPAEQIIAKGFE